MPQLSSTSRPQVHGHRGCRGLRPENTLPAFLHAIELGVDVLELDVVVSHDAQVVVAHDPWLPAALGTGPAGERIDPKYERSYNLYQMPYAGIRRCALGCWPDTRFPEQLPVPTHRPLLREVFKASQQLCREMGRPQVGYSVEIKCTPDGDDLYHPAPEAFVQLVLAELNACSVADFTTILSFDLRVLQATRQQWPKQQLCLLSETGVLPSELFRLLGFTPEVFGPAHTLLSPVLLRQLKSCYPDLKIVPWTINESSELQNAMTWGVDGITTDYPDQLVTLLNL